MNNLIKHIYHCPRFGCKNPDMWAYSQEALETRINFHESSHQIETIRNAVLFDQAMKSKPTRDYNTLVCTWDDLMFLKTRGIAWDEDIQYVGYRNQYRKRTV